MTAADDGGIMDGASKVVGHNCNLVLRILLLFTLDSRASQFCNGAAGCVVGLGLI